MKNRIVKAFLVLAMVFGLAGCTAKKTITLKIDYMEDYTPVVSSSSAFESYSEDVDKIIVTVKKEGTYNLVLQDAAGKEYTIEVVYEGGNVTINTEPLLEFEAVIE